MTTESPPIARGHRISQLGDFAGCCTAGTGLRFSDHQEFHEFSVVDDRFWRLFLDWSGLLYQGSPEPVRTSDDCERATFFPGLMLNYAENLLRIDSRQDGERGGLVAHSGLGVPTR